MCTPQPGSDPNGGIRGMSMASANVRRPDALPESMQRTGRGENGFFMAFSPRAMFQRYADYGAFFPTTDTVVKYKDKPVGQAPFDPRQQWESDQDYARRSNRGGSSEAYRGRDDSAPAGRASNPVGAASGSGGMGTVRTRKRTVLGA